MSVCWTAALAPVQIRPGQTSAHLCSCVRVCVLAGMLVSAIKDGSGMLVRSVVQGGCVSHDGRLGVGDAILAINGEPTSNLTNTKARAMLRRHSVLGPEIRWGPTESMYGVHPGLTQPNSNILPFVFLMDLTKNHFPNLLFHFFFVWIWISPPSTLVCTQQIWPLKR